MADNSAIDFAREQANETKEAMESTRLARNSERDRLQKKKLGINLRESLVEKRRLAKLRENRTNLTKKRQDQERRLKLIDKPQLLGE